MHVTVRIQYEVGDTVHKFTDLHDRDNVKGSYTLLTSNEQVHVVKAGMHLENRLHRTQNCT